MIELTNLRKEFDDLVAVENLTLSISSGEIYGLIGPNGAGKTTTIRMMCGLLEPTQGKVRVAGIDVLGEPERARQYIGYLSDFFSVYEYLKVWEYLDYFAHAYKMPELEIPVRVSEVIAQAGLEVKRDDMIRGLSRGMKQRLGIALRHDPSSEGAGFGRAGFGARSKGADRVTKLAALGARRRSDDSNFVAHPYGTGGFLHFDRDYGKGPTGAQRALRRSDVGRHSDANRAAAMAGRRASAD